MPKILLKFKDTIQKVVEMDKPRFTIGRGAGNDIRIDNLAVSSSHAKIEKQDGYYQIEDLDSTNGTFIDDKRISKQPLNDSDAVTIGKHTLIFLLEGEELVADVPDPASDTAPADLDQTMILDTRAHRERLSKAARDGGQAAAKAPVGVLTIMKGSEGQREYALKERLTLIGKDKGAGVKLSGLLTPRIGGYVARDPNGYTLIPPDGSNKIKINGRPTENGVLLNDGDRIEIGSVKLRFHLES